MDKFVNGIANGIGNTLPIFIFTFLIGFGFWKIGGLLCNGFYCLFTGRTFITVVATPTFLLVFLFFFISGYRNGYRRIGDSPENDS